MSASSSASWRGAADILDLDRYMRGAASPHHPHKTDRLVVDCGGAAGGMAAPNPAPLTRKPSSSSTSVSYDKPRDKRYSHDSGLSDESYVGRRTQRRPITDHATARANKVRERARETHAVNSAHSMRTFRAACERTLKEQQEQIARVAKLCERLTRVPPQPPPRRAVHSSTSDTSSSSRSNSTRDRGRKDRHRTDECKTYKIIMTKLDELNRALSSRKQLARVRARSVDSVSVSDKLVATEPPANRGNTARKAPNSTSAGCQVSTAASARTRSSAGRAVYKNTVLVERAVGSHARGGDARGRTPAEPRPGLRAGCINVAAESLVEYESDCTATASSEHAPHCPFDLDDPLHLYAQAKRLQTLHAATLRRAHSAEPRRHRSPAARDKDDSDHCHSHISLCGRCLGYWRALTTLAAQLFHRLEPAV